MAICLLAFVVLTSYLRLPLGRHLWTSVYFSIYFAAVALFFQSLFSAPGLKNDSIDWLDGGKRSVESCFLGITSISLLRWCHSRRKAAHLRQAAAALSRNHRPESTSLASLGMTRDGVSAECYVA